MDDTHLLAREPPQEYRDEWTTILATLPENPPTDTKSFLVFRLGKDQFALELASVYSITEKKTVHPFPMISNKVIRGVASIDGQLKTILCLHSLLDIEQPVTNKQKNKWILIGNSVDFFGFEVEELLGIQLCEIHAIHPPPANIGLIKGVINNNHEIIGILDEDKLFKA